MRITHQIDSNLNVLVRGTHPTFLMLVQLPCTKRLPETSNGLIK
ncbi:hypothetical protein [Alysiella crassa]|nr:hypothetical protein [Alysiella crassa]